MSLHSHYPKKCPVCKSANVHVEHGVFKCDVCGYENNRAILSA